MLQNPFLRKQDKKQTFCWSYYEIYRLFEFCAYYSVDTDYPGFKNKGYFILFSLTFYVFCVFLVWYAPAIKIINSRNTSLIINNNTKIGQPLLRVVFLKGELYGYLSYRTNSGIWIANCPITPCTRHRFAAMLYFGKLF